MQFVSNSLRWDEGPIVAAEGERCVKGQWRWTFELGGEQSGVWWWFGRVGVSWRIGWLEGLQSSVWF